MKLAWVTGANGLIGNLIVQTAPAYAPAWQVRGLTRAEFDLLDLAALERQFAEDRPELIIHCAAVSTVAAAKANPELARKVNVELTARLAELAADISFVFFSTDLIYDGTRGNYGETDAPNPLHLYGETKAEAELLVRRNSRHLILRTSINGGISDTRNRGFNEQLRLALQQGQGMTLFTDEFRCPIPAVVTIRALWDLVEQAQAGIFNVAGATRLSRWEIGQLLLPRWPELAEKAAGVTVGSAKDFPGPPRALDTSLDISKLQAVLKTPVPGLGEWLTSNPHEPF